MTEELEQAQANLDHAITTLMALLDNEAGLTQYVVVASHEVVQPEGAVTTSYEVIVGDGDIAMHIALGLVEFAKQFLLRTTQEE